MNKQYNFFDFLKAGMFSGAGWTALAIFCYALFYYGYCFFYLYSEHSRIFAVERFIEFALLLVSGVFTNGIIGLCLGIILAGISYAIFPRPYEVERIYRNSLLVVTMLVVLVAGSLSWQVTLCIAIGQVYVQTLSFVMMLNVLIFGRICQTCCLAYLNRPKAKTVYSG